MKMFLRKTNLFFFVISKFCCKNSDKNNLIELCAMTFQGNWRFLATLQHSNILMSLVAHRFGRVEFPIFVLIFFNSTCLKEIITNIQNLTRQNWWATKDISFDYVAYPMGNYWFLFHCNKFPWKIAEKMRKFQI